MAIPASKIAAQVVTIGVVISDRKDLVALSISAGESKEDGVTDTQKKRHAPIPGVGPDRDNAWHQINRSPRRTPHYNLAYFFIKPLSDTQRSTCGGIVVAARSGSNSLYNRPTKSVCKAFSVLSFNKHTGRPKASM